MAAEPSIYLVIAIMAVVTLFTRLIGPEIMLWVPPSPAVERFLQALSTSVIAALVVSYLMRGGIREALAVAVAGLIVLRLGNPVIAMFAGMIVAAVWARLAG